MTQVFDLIARGHVMVKLLETIISDVRPIFIFAISNSYELLSLLNTLGKPEKLYCTGFGQANAEIQRFEEH